MEIRYRSFAIAEWTTRAWVAGMAAWGKFSIRCSFATRSQDSLDSEGMAAFLQPGHVVRPAISPESVLRANTPVDVSDSYGPMKPTRSFPYRIFITQRCDAFGRRVA